MRDYFKIFVWIGLGIFALSSSAQAREYTFQEIAENPTQLDRKPLQVTGIVKGLRRSSMSNGTSYQNFKLLEQSSGRYISVTWYVFGCNKPLSDFNLQEGREAVVLGEFRRISMSRVSQFLGNLYVNDDARNAACSDQYRRTRRR